MERVGRKDQEGREKEEGRKYVENTKGKNEEGKNGKALERERGMEEE